MAKPGFLLIEIMTSFLLLIVAGSIMGFYLAYGQKQQKTALRQLEASLVAHQVLDQMEEGYADFISHNHYQVSKNQHPLAVDWDDGVQEQVWLGQVQVSWQDKRVILETILEKKAL